ncbi:MAG TPA: excinuclease ABC subunit C [Firmicutes bacterium]|jgi:hypothetical protein|nr:excinuclease ABC subunit C [Bacillota bacterium]
MARREVPDEVEAIRRGIEQCLSATDQDGKVISNAKYGVYAFYDYDGEPIYVGQTMERLRVRIRRHLTNQRTDAVAMNVLDPFEVAEIEMWPFFELEDRQRTTEEVKNTLNAAEYTVFNEVLDKSSFSAVLNEKPITSSNMIGLPQSFRKRIIPDELYELRKHPDIRIARRANTIARLAQVISERSVSKGLRHTLLVQAQRLERLAANRLAEFLDEPDDSDLDESND